jgi:hypothetical protein
MLLLVLYQYSTVCGRAEEREREHCEPALVYLPTMYIYGVKFNHHYIMFITIEHVDAVIY